MCCVCVVALAVHEVNDLRSDLEALTNFDIEVRLQHGLPLQRLYVVCVAFAVAVRHARFSTMLMLLLLLLVLLELGLAKLAAPPDAAGASVDAAQQQPETCRRFTTTAGC
jgi:hypothetical protein